ncbi:hypothetical protein [Edaphobacter acidisoli]|nr:hypothetical protein [Edaphobacter acidisoli]
MVGRAISMWSRARYMFALGVALIALGGVIAAGQAAQPGTVDQKAIQVPTAKPGEVPTLHVYADLIDVPVLVMGPGWEPIPRIANDRFRVSIGGGPPYRVQHVRLEGEDPISLGILLDLRGSQDELLKTMGKDLGRLVPGSLHAQDRVSMYGLDCGLVRSLNDVPVTQQDLRHGVRVLLDARQVRRNERPKRACPTGQHFWDSVGAVVVEISRLPGRRVVLVVSDGYDSGSNHRANSVRLYAQLKGVAIFGLADAAVSLQWRQLFEAPFDDVCQLSGGMIAPADSKGLAGQLQAFLAKVRGRYILEFPRPYNATPGGYSLDVRIDHSDAWIRAAGISFPIEDSAVKNDPTTVQGDPSLTPVQGPHRVLEDKH